MADVVHLERLDLMDEMLAKVKDGRRNGNPTIYRPSKSVLKTNSSQYFPRYISLGLYNAEIEVKESTCATIDRNKLQIKLEMANVFQETVKKSWKEICRLVVENPEDMKKMYDDCPIDDIQAVRNILTLDAVFVTCILHTLSDVHKSESHSVRPRFADIAEVVHEQGLSKGNTGVLLDILAILQNQIPFQLITNVVEMMYETPAVNGFTGSPTSHGSSSPDVYQTGDASSFVLDFGASPTTDDSRSTDDQPLNAASALNSMVEVARGLMMYNLPGRGDAPLQGSPLEAAQYSHLLDCVYKTALQQCTDSPWEWPEENDDTHPIATATQLRRAGINIVRGAENISEIRFRRGILEATLILPQLRITTWTETILRNLLEYERKVLKKGDLMCYLSFMDQLIDTEQDVLLLKEKKHSVIELSHLSSDEHVANMFNSLLNNSSEVPLSRKWANLRKDIHRFYSSEKRQLWVEFYEIHFGRPWITVSVVAALALLVMTFIQTMYAMKSYYGDDGKANFNNTKSG